MSGPFKRTVCACKDCLACCERQPGYLVPEDIDAISEYLGEPADPFLVASPGAVVARASDDAMGIELVRVGSIVPRTTTPGGRCVFLESDGRCAIHPVAPFGCAMFDTHQRTGEWETRSQWGVRRMMEWQYQEKRSTLAPAKTYNPTFDRD